MPSLNKVLLMGHLTRDPELRVTPRGTPICQFSLAINRTFKLESGETRDEVIYVDVEAWGKQGETIAKHVTKGRPLYVEGRLRLDQWEDKNTKEKRSRMKVVLEQFQFLGSPPAQAPAKEPAQAPAKEPAQAPAKEAAPAPGQASSPDQDEDGPF